MASSVSLGNVVADSTDADESVLLDGSRQHIMYPVTAKLPMPDIPHDGSL